MYASRMSEHQSRVEFLRALVTLAGYSVRLPCLLGGLIPDVLQFSPSSGGLFVGDAKHTESPRDQQMQVRLLRYLSFLKLHVRRPGTHGVFAICFGDHAEGYEWTRTIAMLMSEVGIPNVLIRSSSF